MATRAEGNGPASCPNRRCDNVFLRAMQLRYLQTLTAIAGEKTSTITFPMPIDLIASVLDRLSDRRKPG